MERQEQQLQVAKAFKTEIDLFKKEKNFEYFKAFQAWINALKEKSKEVTELKSKAIKLYKQAAGVDFSRAVNHIVFLEDMYHMDTQTFLEIFEECEDWEGTFFYIGSAVKEILESEDVKDEVEEVIPLGLEVSPEERGKKR